MKIRITFDIDEETRRAIAFHREDDGVAPRRAIEDEIQDVVDEHLTLLLCDYDAARAGLGIDGGGK